MKKISDAKLAFASAAIAIIGCTTGAVLLSGPPSARAASAASAASAAETASASTANTSNTTAAVTQFSSVAVKTQTADLSSTLAQHAARTTTATEPFRYTLKQPGGLTLLYNGCRSSKIEPCGCRALNLGGIDKEAAMIQTIRRANPQTLFMDAGGYFRELPDPPMRLQTWFMLKALRALDCQVMNIGYPDLQQGLTSLQFFQKKFDLPLISANILDGNAGKPIFPAYKTFEMTLSGGAPMRVAVVGVTAASRDVSRGSEPAQNNATSREDKSAALFAPAQAESGRWMIAETNGSIPWLPFNIHGSSAPRVEDARPNGLEQPDVAGVAGRGGAAPASPAGGKLPLPVQFAVQGGSALTSQSLSPYKVQDVLTSARDVGQELRKTNDLLVLLAYTSFDHAVKMAPELRDYDLIIAADYVERMEPVRPVADGPLVVCGDHEGKYLGIVETTPPGAGAGARAQIADADLLPILQSILPLPSFHKYIDDFAALTEKLPVEEPSTQLSQKIYAGVTSCRACHIAEFNQWKTHKHSQAMKTLVTRNMHYNPDCLKCHTVAYRQPGGFTDVRVTAYLANVQCEVCHGPGEQHVRDMRAAEAMKREGKTPPPSTTEMRMEWNQQFCMQCHDPQNDPQFNFVEDIQRVRHKNPAPPRIRPATVPLD